MSLFRGKLITGIIFGGSLAALAIWIGVHSLGDALITQSNFTLLDEVPFSAASSTEFTAFAAKAEAVLPKPKKVPPKVEPIIIPPSLPVAPPDIAPVVVAPEPQPISQPQPAFVVAPVVSPSTVNNSIVLISEVLVGTEVSGDDEFIELYNAGQQPVDLTGWSVTKKTASGNESSLVAKARLQGKSIAPNQYFLLVHDGSNFGGAAPDAFWAKSNSLAAKNNSIVLRSAVGVKVDEVGWTEIPKSSSYARVPLMDGAVFSIQNVSTPRQ